MTNVLRYVLGVLLMAGACGQGLTAQYKYEKEERINEDEVPEQALDFVKEIQPTRKDKWYREQNLDGEAIEVKLKRNGERYSIKFDTEGELIDVEKLIKWRDIPEETRDEIDEEWEEFFERRRIEKIQIHYKDDAENLIRFIQSPEGAPLETPIYYEIVVKGKTEGPYQLYEFLFDEEGEKVEMSRILTRRTDNMEF